MILKLDIDDKSDKVSVALMNPSGTTQDSYSIIKSIYERNINDTASALENSILPAAVRYLNLKTGVVLFERPPCYVPFYFSSAYQSTLHADSPSQLQFNLPIPWQRYALFFAHNGMPHKIFVFFANAQINSLDDDPMSLAPLPNLYEDGSVCLPVFSHVDYEKLDLISAISNAYNIVWKSGFNMDIMKAYTEWLQRMIADNPLVSTALHNPGVLNKFYSAWAGYTLEEIVSFNWRAPVFNSFNTLLSGVISSSTSVTLHERVVDLLLAARNVK